jgi:hypothetical protein
LRTPIRQPEGSISQVERPRKSIAVMLVVDFPSHAV